MPAAPSTCPCAQALVWTLAPTSPLLTPDPPSLLLRRHVILPKAIAKKVPKNTLLTEVEWRSIGVQQSRGWIHYMIHRPGVCWTCAPPPTPATQPAASSCHAIGLRPHHTACRRSR